MTGNKRSRDVLSDQTKRAKDVAGQFMQNLVMTYSECQLQGRLAGEGMKDALEPGLWTVLECMSAEMKRKTNAALDADSRVIWKRLYDDWNQVGRWKG